MGVQSIDHRSAKGCAPRLAQPGRDATWLPLQLSITRQIQGDRTLKRNAQHRCPSALTLRVIILTMASRPAAPTKRTSISAADLAPKPPCQIHSLAVISEKAQITGSHPVEIGENSVLHPYSKIRSDHGPVTIGRNCTVSEKAVVGTAVGEGEVIIGDEVNIETGAIVEAASVGDGTVIEVGVVVGKGAKVGKVRYCLHFQF